jgi:ABC-2 type transport system permease protein
MRLPAAIDKLAAVVRRDLLIASRYRYALAFIVVGTATEIAFSYYLARAVGPGFRPEGMAYYPYLLVGTSAYSFLLVGANRCLAAVQEAQTSGSLEALMATSTSPPLLLFLSSLSRFAGSSLGLILYLGLGLAIVPSTLVNLNVLSTIIVLFLSLLLGTSVAAFAAALQVAVQRGAAALWVLGAGWVLSGTMYPISVMPCPLQKLAALLPLTYSIRALRLALLEGASVRQIAPTLLTLALFVAALLPLSMWMFSQAMRLARKRGTLSLY